MIGISFHSGGHVDKPLPWLIEHLAGIGYDAIEIVCGPKAHILTGEPLEPQLAQTKELLAKHGLVVSAINPYTQPAMVNFAKEDFDGCVARWSTLVDIAVALNATHVNFLTGWLSDGDTAAWRLLIDVLKALMPYAESQGKYLAIHNHEANIIDSPDKCLRLIEAVGSPNLKVLCDITNFYILGADIGQAIHRVGPHIVHCHLKGVMGKYPYNEFIVPGDERDEEPFEPFAAALGEVGYDRYISAETFTRLRQDKAQVAYDMMAPALAKLGLRP